MTDAEGIRNLVGNGLVQLAGSLVTAVLALAYLFYLSWQLTLAGGAVSDGSRTRTSTSECGYSWPRP